MDNITMIEKDAIRAKMAKVFLTIGNQRYRFINATDVELKFTKNKTEVPVMGKTGTGSIPTSWKGTGSAKFYGNISHFKELALKFKDTGETIFFDLQITNDDPNSQAGRQTITAKDCDLDDTILAKAAANDDLIEEDVNFTFNDFDMPEKFKTLMGMQ